MAALAAAQNQAKQIRISAWEREALPRPHSQLWNWQRMKADGGRIIGRIIGSRRLLKIIAKVFKEDMGQVLPSTWRRSLLVQDSLVYRVTFRTARAM